MGEEIQKKMHRRLLHADDLAAYIEKEGESENCTAVCAFIENRSEYYINDRFALFIRTFEMSSKT